MRTRTLLTHVLAVNAALVALTAAVSAFVARRQLEDGRLLLLIGLAVACAILANSLLLRRRLEREHRDAGRAVVRAQEEERARIAHDLHDEVNQALTAILLRLQAAGLEAPAGLAEELRETQALATQAMDELLRLARQLRPSALDDHGLVPALARQVADFADRTGIDSSFDHSGPPPELSGEEQLVLYRVTQESLSNVLQHAGAATVRVQLSSNGRTVLRIRDDGRGFRTTADGARLGLTGMRERALLVGGRLAVVSAPGEGTTVELTVGAA